MRAIQSTFLVLVASSPMSALAGVSTTFGFTTMVMSWAPLASSTPVPSLSTPATIALSTLMGLIAYRMLASRHGAIKISLSAILGVTVATLGLHTAAPEAGGPPSPIVGSSCVGSQEYTSYRLRTPPPCFKNTCGAPVRVSYQFVDGETDKETPITASSCTKAYTCQSPDDASEITLAAEDGAVVSSSDQWLATAYCLEQGSS